MALEIKQLGSASFAVGDSPKDPLYTAVTSGKAQIVKNMRFVNTHASSSVTLNVFLVTASGSFRVTPKDMTLSAGAMYVDDDEITLEATHKLKATLSGSGGPVEYVISGIQRDA